MQITPLTENIDFGRLRIRMKKSKRRKLPKIAKEEPLSAQEAMVLYAREKQKHYRALLGIGDEFTISTPINEIDEKVNAIKTVKKSGFFKRIANTIKRLIKRK